MRGKGVTGMTASQINFSISTLYGNQGWNDVIQIYDKRIIKDIWRS